MRISRGRRYTTLTFKAGNDQSFDAWIKEAEKPDVGLLQAAENVVKAHPEFLEKDNGF